MGMRARACLADNGVTGIKADRCCLPEGDVQVYGPFDSHVNLDRHSEDVALAARHWVVHVDNAVLRTKSILL